MPKPRTDTERLDFIDRCNKEFEEIIGQGPRGFKFVVDGSISAYNRGGEFGDGTLPTIREAIDAYMDAREEEK